MQRLWLVAFLSGSVCGLTAKSLGSMSSGGGFPTNPHFWGMIAQACGFILITTSSYHPTKFRAARQSAAVILGLSLGALGSLVPLSRGTLPTSGGGVFQALRLGGLHHLRSYDSNLAAWIDSLVWGHIEAMPRPLRDTFKVVGVFHLLSVSGSHVTAFVLLTNGLLLSPWYLAHLLSLFAGHRWTMAKQYVPLCGVPIIIGYFILVGPSQAAMRATVIAICHIVTTSKKDRLPTAAAIQSVLLPWDFLSPANLMSWAGYLCILDFMQRKANRGLQRKVMRLLGMQTELAIWSCLCFGQLSIVGIAANLILVPVFAPVFFGAIGLAILPDVFLGLGAHYLQFGFLAAVDLFAQLTAKFPFLWVSHAERWPIGVTVPLIAGNCWLSAQRLRRLTAKPAASAAPLTSPPPPQYLKPSSCPSQSSH